MDSEENEQKDEQRKRLIWFSCSALLLGGHLWLSSSLWRVDIPPGEVVFGGPGDGLYFLFFLLFPWFFVQLINFGYFIAGLIEGIRKKHWRTCLLFGGITSAWIVVGAIELFLMNCPQGVTCAGG